MENVFLASAAQTKLHRLEAALEDVKLLAGALEGDLVQLRRELNVSATVAQSVMNHIHGAQAAVGAAQKEIAAGHLKLDALRDRFAIPVTDTGVWKESDALAGCAETGPMSQVG
ncbi:hypothetical protein [Caulobacter sp.]|uniref:hypothetical protein n=1 Tax=Caulobacter sp. TaxID=78 RepID=UPI002B4A2545|nr:hypothetical protein [Caulobacter sp.]HJV42001.1 hypothetical protein [Caulobacter sp.]